MKTTFNDCCRHGKMRIHAESRPFPDELKKLFLREDDDWPNFMEHIRNYNSALSFASINCKKDVSVRSNGRAPYCYKVQGKVYSMIHTGARPEEDGPPRYAQLYVIDTEQANQIRTSNPQNQGADAALMYRLDGLIRAHSRHAEAFEMLREEEQRLREEAERNAHRVDHVEMLVPEVRLLFSLKDHVDPRTYNPPRCNEIAAVFQTTADGLLPPAHLVIRNRGGEMQTLSTLDENLEPMTFPLFFPHGTPGWRPKIPYAESDGKRRYVSRREFVCQRVAVRPAEFNPIHCGGKLTQEYFVVNYAHIEGDRMEWFRQNQATIHADRYNVQVSERFNGNRKQD